MRSSVFTFSLVVFLIIRASPAEAQLSTKSKKAAELYTEADNFRVRGQYTQAIDLLEKNIIKIVYRKERIYGTANNQSYNESPNSPISMDNHIIGSNTEAEIGRFRYTFIKYTYA